MGREIHHSLIITSQCCGAIPQAQMSFVNKKRMIFIFNRTFFYFAQSLSDDTEY
ncbi:hypothetical protein [Klebsiella pneumoniae IS53]|nr:hypothetical protein [Klebsiella pneumoniae IS53]